MKDGGPAFPVVKMNGIYPTIPGMSLRDWFAGQALAGMLSADGNDPRWTGRDTSTEYQQGGGKWIDPMGVARQAYEIADAMLKAREESQP